MRIIEDDNPYAPHPDSWHEGWHYTSWSNWLKIQQEGLRTTPLSQDKLKVLEGLAHPDWDGKAVWVWVNQLSPIEHMGSVIYQLAKRSETRVVMLKLRYQFKQRLAPKPGLGGTRINLFHNGSIDLYKYHQRTPSCLLVETLTPDRLTLVSEFDLIDLLGVP